MLRRSPLLLLVAAALALTLAENADATRELKGGKRNGERKEAAPPTAPSSGCCWTFSTEQKRYQFYPRPASTACVDPYKLAECPAAGQTTPSYAKTEGAASAAPVRTPPLPCCAAAAAPEAAAPRRPRRRRHPRRRPRRGRRRRPRRRRRRRPPRRPPRRRRPRRRRRRRRRRGGGGSEKLIGMLVLAVAVVGACVCRSKLKAAAGEYFPDADAKKTKGGKAYKSVNPNEKDTDGASQTSCGEPSESIEVDAAAEEWANQIAAQRSGVAYNPGASTRTLACAGAVAGGCGAGPVPSFGPGGGGASLRELKAAEEGFGGFDGFGDEGGGGADEYDERRGTWGGGGGGGGGGGAGAYNTPQPPQRGIGDFGLQSAADFGDIGALEGVGQPKADANIDWGALGESDGGGSNDPFFGGRRRGPARGARRRRRRRRRRRGRRLHRVRRVWAGQQAGARRRRQAAGGGLSWDEERQQWERANKSSFGLGGFGSRGGFGGGGGASPWDLRSAGLKTPASLRAFRQQAEKVRRPAPAPAPPRPIPRSPTPPPPRPPTPPRRSSTTTSRRRSSRALRWRGSSGRPTTSSRA